MALALDLLIPVIITVTAIVGYRRGFVRYLIKLIGTIACIVVALVVSDMLADPVYEHIVAPRLEKTLNKQFEGFDIGRVVRKGISDEGTEVTLSDKELRQVLSDGGSLPAAFERAAKQAGDSVEKAAEVKESADRFFKNGFGNQLAKTAGFDDDEEVGKRLDMSSGKVYDLVRAFASGEDNTSGVKYLVNNVIDGMMTTLIRFILFAIIFIICEAIIAVVFIVAGVLDHLPMVDGINKTGGLILGILKGVLYIFLLAAICSAFVKSGSYVTADEVEETIVFKYFFSVFYK